METIEHYFALAVTQAQEILELDYAKEISLIIFGALLNHFIRGILQRGRKKRISEQIEHLNTKYKGLNEQYESQKHRLEHYLIMKSIFKKLTIWLYFFIIALLLLLWYSDGLYQFILINHTAISISAVSIAVIGMHMIESYYGNKVVKTQKSFKVIEEELSNSKKFILGCLDPILLSNLKTIVKEEEHNNKL